MPSVMPHHTQNAGMIRTDHSNHPLRQQSRNTTTRTVGGQRLTLRL